MTVFSLWMFPQVVNAKVYGADYKALLKDPKIQWVMIGSKNCLHKEHCISAFEAGKNVFCEKPLAISVDECVAIRNAQKKYGKIFATGFVLRYLSFIDLIELN